MILNTAGGITGGDRFAYRAAAGPGARLSLTTQAAERAYRAQPQETGHVHAHLTAAEGARIDWLPQETILFDGSALSRRLEVDLAPDATLLAVEPLIFGRAAMGERLRALRFSEQWRVRRAGRLVFADALRLQGPAEEILAGPATLAGHRAMASILLAAPDAERFLAPLRTLCPASLIRPGILAARITAPSGFELRHILLPALELLRGAPLPKVWTL
ncbi:MAG: urease accessory protein UreD [Pseudomonadota bacterium]